MPWAEQIFTGFALIVSAGVSSHIAYGHGTRKAKELFATLILAIILGGQLYHLIQASTYIPATRFYVWNDALHRTDCIESSKGGKRPGNTTKTEDMNPCFCTGTLATCYSVTSSATIDLSSATCPTDGTYKCKQGNSKADRIHRYVPRLRDCHGGQGTMCTMDQPCTPCERSKLETFKGGRCRTCSTMNRGDCGFVPGVGPYCLISPDSKAIEPCSQCCTEPDPYYDDTGYCY